MKITGVTTYLLKVALGKERFYSSQCAFPERNSLLVKVETDVGITGWGESGQYGPGEPVATFIEVALRPLLIGRNPLEVNVLWETMFTSIRDFGRKTTGVEAISGIDIALWDIAGKFYDKPVCELLGGAFRKKVRGYATGCYYRGEDVLDCGASLSAIEAEARSYVDAGFTAMKGKVGLLQVDQDARRVEAMRKGAGEGTILMIDANHAYNLHTAKRMGRHLERLGVYFFEEPVLPEDMQGYAALRSALDMAIAAGENEFTRYGFYELIRNGCLDIIQPNIGCAGGFTEVRRIEAIANTAHVQTIPHCWGSGVALAAALQLCAAMAPMPHTAFPTAPQNEPMVEYDRNFNPLRDELLTERFDVRDGYVAVPQGPGLGIEIKMDVIEKYLQK